MLSTSMDFSNSDKSKYWKGCRTRTSTSLPTEYIYCSSAYCYGLNLIPQIHMLKSLYLGMWLYLEVIWLLSLKWDEDTEDSQIKEWMCEDKTKTQERGLRMKPTLPTPGSWTSQFPSCEKVSICLKYPVSGTLLW